MSGRTLTKLSTKWVLIPLLLLLLVGISLANGVGRPPIYWFEQGLKEKQNPVKARQCFAAAGDAFKRLHETYLVRNLPLFLMWGNVEILAERFPRAIFAYRLGLKLVPHEDRLLENLAYARERVVYPPGQHPPPLGDSWPTWLPRPSIVFLLCCTLFFYSLACLSAAHWFLTNRRGLLNWAGLFLLLAGVFGYWWCDREAQIHLDLENPLVVIIQETGLYRGNGEAYPRHEQVPFLYPGMEARKLVQRGGWLQIKLAEGTMGWVPRQAVLVDDRRGKPSWF